MKQISFFTTLLVFCCSQFIIGQEKIVFFEGDFQVALEKAKEENKLIFIDIYADWCGPCKRMSREVFTNFEVAKFYNNNFISIAINPEKTPNHPFLKGRQAPAYPSFYWLSSSGDVRLNETGYMKPELFLSKGKESIHSNITTLYKKYSDLWDKSVRDPQTVLQFLKLLVVIEPEKELSILKEYITNLSKEDLLLEDNYKIIKNLAWYERENPDIATKILVSNQDIYRAFEESGIFDNNMYRQIVRMHSAMREDILNQQVFLNKLDSLLGNDLGFYRELIEIENQIFNKKYKEGIQATLDLVQKEKKEWIYSEILYTLIISDYFLEKVVLDTNKLVIDMANCSLREFPSKATLMYAAISYAHQGDYEKSYQLLANMNLYDSPSLSNAVYNKLNLKVIRPNSKKQDKNGK